MELFEDVKTPLKRKNLIPITKLNIEMVKKSTSSFNDYDELKNRLEKFGLSIDKLYHSPIGLYPFWYVDGYLFMPLPNVDAYYLESFCESGAIEQNKYSLDKKWKEKDYESFFSHVDSQFGFDVFFELLDEISEDKQYETFIRLYVHNEYGFQDLDKKVIRKIFSLNQDKSFIEKLPVDEDGYVTIYRGMQEKSAPVEEAYSWTLDYVVAKRFALRYNSLESKIVQAKIKPENIVDAITFGRIGDRSEKEVLVLPEHLEHIKDLSFYNLSDEMFKELNDAGIVLLYQNFAHYQLQRKWFHKPDGIHGLRHMKRVLFLSLMMSYLDNLSDEDRNILIYASLYHDIGRKNDWEDEGHGMQSVLKRRKLKLPTDGLSKEAVKIMEFVMKYHSIRDEVGLAKIEQEHGIKDKERAIDLFKRFKDCDNLDRVRLGDLDAKYLRTETGKRLELVAYTLLRNIE